jgi:hypothetical protein
MNKIAKRTAHCLNVSENLIQNSVKLDRDNEKYNNNAKSKTTTRKDTIDQFNKDFINTVAYNLFQSLTEFCIKFSLTFKQCAVLLAILFMSEMVLLALTHR